MTLVVPLALTAPVVVEAVVDVVVEIK